MLDWNFSLRLLYINRNYMFIFILFIHSREWTTLQKHSCHCCAPDSSNQFRFIFGSHLPSVPLGGRAVTLTWASRKLFLLAKGRLSDVQVPLGIFNICLRDSRIMFFSLTFYRIESFENLSIKRISSVHIATFVGSQAAVLSRVLSTPRSHIYAGALVARICKSIFVLDTSETSCLYLLKERHTVETYCPISLRVLAGPNRQKPQLSQFFYHWPWTCFAFRLLSIVFCLLIMSPMFLYFLAISCIIHLRSGTDRDMAVVSFGYTKYKSFWLPTSRFFVPYLILLSACLQKLIV